MPAHLPQAVLNIEDKARSNLFAWRGQFSPQLIEALLDAYASPRAVVLDPFAGSGTVLAECARKGHEVYGAEINPAAATMARTYTLATFAPRKRASLLRRVDAALGEVLEPSGRTKGAEDLRPGLVEVHQSLRRGHTRAVVEVLICNLDFFKGARDRPTVLSTWERLKQLIRALPTTPRPVRMLLADARQLPLSPGTVDLVITSPPYINVFNYHQQRRRSMEALGWDVLSAARSEVGSNRKHRGNRLLTVTQYCLDMTAALEEMARVSKRSARAILVVGRESNVRKTAFYNGEIVKRLARECLGFSLALEQERVFQNRFGVDIYEDILHLGLSRGPSTTTPRDVARDVLEDARRRAPAESHGDLEAAIAKVDDVQPSPLFVARGSTDDRRVAEFEL